MNTNRNTEQIEADINDVRERMDATLDELEHRLDVRRMLRDGLAELGNTEVVRYAASAASRAGRTAREHPVPAALAGAGLLGLVAWGLRSGFHSRGERKALRNVSHAVDSARERLSTARKSLLDSAGGTGKRLRDAGSSTWHQLEDAGSEARSMARRHPVATSAIGVALVALAALVATPAVRDRLTGK